MKAAIGVYDTHADAIDALKQLKDSGYPEKSLSLIGKADALEYQVVFRNTNLMNVAGAEVGISAVIGSTLGVLTGVGLFAIPGLGFLFGAGALVGAIAGFDFGLIGGGVISALTVTGIATADVEEYETHLKEGRFLVVAQGSPEEVQKAKDILHGHGRHAGLKTH